LVVFHITSVLFERLRFRRFTPIKFGLILWTNRNKTKKNTWLE
jgi:hypothetical protein